MTAASTGRANRVLSVVWLVFGATVISILAQSIRLEIVQFVSNGAWIAMGALLVVRRPGNIIGPLLIASGLGWTISVAADVTAGTLAEHGNTAAGSWVFLVFSVLTIPLLWLIIPTTLLFPFGRNPTKAVRRVLIGTGTYTAFVMMAAVFGRPTILGLDDAPFAHPFISDGPAQTMRDITTVGTLGILLGQIVATGMLLARYRRSSPIERRQIGWFGYSALLYHLLSNLLWGVNPLGLDNDQMLAFEGVIFLLIPLGISIGILRYRLYDIDTIINRSVTFSALAVFIAGVYVAIVVGVGQLIPGEAGFGLSVIASVLVAMAFQPARRRVQRWANRLVYGERATPYEVLVRFSRRSAELSDEELLLRVPELIVDGTGATTATLWTRTEDGFTTAAIWPDISTNRQLPGSEGFVDPDADYSVPVFHDAELLGGLSLVKPTGESITPIERSLLADLAAGMGLALRNAQLTGELRRQVAELEASRERVLAASDAARRSLENDLDSGPQQTLVAVKVKLGPTRKRVEQAGVEKLASLLAQLEIEAGEAIRSVREFAGGIYPPLLEAEGLETAIGQEARKSAIPVSIRGTGVKRYPRDVEVAVYFSILEALQNTNKYSEATSATVTLAATNGALMFEVQDDGRGFDTTTISNGAGLTGMVDRLDTLGGVVRVTSAPNAGTQITGSVPIRQLVNT